MAAPLSPTLRVTLRLVQLLLALLYVGTGLYKLLLPARLPWPWTQQHSTLVAVTGALDVLGGLGVLLPTLTGIRPRLARLAALGLVLLQAGATAFHLSRGEAANTPFNFAMLALAAFTWWGLGRPAPR